MKFLVETPYIDHKSFYELDHNPLENLRVWPVANSDAERLILGERLRALHINHWGSDPEDSAFTVQGALPTEPQVRLSEIGTEAEADKRRRYSEALEAHEAQKELDRKVKFLLAGEYEKLTLVDLHGYLKVLNSWLAEGGAVPMLYFVDSQ